MNILWGKYYYTFHFIIKSQINKIIERIGVVVRDNYGYRSKNRKSKGFILVALACFLCLSAIAFGASALSRKGEKKEKETNDIVDLNTAKNNDEDKKDDENVAVDGNVIKNTEQETKDNQTNDNQNINSNKTQTNQTINNVDKDNKEETGSVNDNSNTAADNASDAASNEAQNKTLDVNALVSSLSFGEGSTLQWPVEGNIILNYSMDSTIYFPTLDSYRCNPAIIIQSESGTSVCAGAKGVVKEVSSNEEIGNYVVVGIGDGYELTYGQLKDITVALGDTVESNTAIGVVGEVTRYYKNEGSNVYFKMEKDGNPCDPLDFLE